jgi:hypothetical protein
MKLLDLENPSEFCFANDCIMDDSGIFAMPIDKHTRDILIGDEWDTRKQFEEDIKLKLPCSPEILTLWLKKNGFDDLLEKLSRIKGIAHTKALRKVGSPSSYTDPQRSHNIVSANKVLNSVLIKANGDLHQYTQLNIQKLILEIEQQRIQKASYNDEVDRAKQLDTISNKIKEINWFLDDCPLVVDPTTIIHKYSGLTSSTTLNISANNLLPAKRTSQIISLTWRVYLQLTKEKKPTSAQKVWSEIRVNHANYEDGDIIQEVTKDNIYWTSAQQNEQNLKRSSFDSALSKLKKSPPF